MDTMDTAMAAVMDADTVVAADPAGSTAAVVTPAPYSMTAAAVADAVAVVTAAAASR